jgi:CheY-like chemotaxis protein
MPQNLANPAFILLVEDDDNDAFGMELAFRDAGLSANFRRVNDGQAAIDYLAGNGIFADRIQHPFPSLLLVDWHMHCKNGAEVLRWVRAHPSFEHLVTVILSGSESEADRRQAYLAGANSYLIKPGNFKDLVKMLASCESYWKLNHVPNQSKGHNAAQAP